VLEVESLQLLIAISFILMLLIVTRFNDVVVFIH